MKNQQQPLPQFELSPLAKAGVFIVNMHSRNGKDEHDIYRPHRDTHYLLMLATQGHFSLTLDFEPLTLTAPLILCILPGQVHHIIEMHQMQGWSLGFDPVLIDPDFRLLLEKGFAHPIPLDPQTAFYYQLTTLADLMEKLQVGTADPYTSRSIQALLAALLSIIAGQMAITKDNKTKKSRGFMIEQAFVKLLKQHYKTWKQPAQYASQLAISVSHLNDTLKEINGRSLSTHIQQFSILEAKRLLYFTELTVKEIGYEVGYDEPVYFGKLFKKLTRLTPLQFRQKFRD